MVTLKLPFPPSVNRIYKIGQRRHSSKRTIYMTSDAHHFVEYVNLVVKQKKLDLFTKNHRLRVSIILHNDSLRKYDIDNRVKKVLDALQFAKLIYNDNQVDELFVKRGEKTHKAHCIVSVESIACKNTL